MHERLITANLFEWQRRGDPAPSLATGTAVEDIPEDWECPSCGAGAEVLKRIG